MLVEPEGRLVGTSSLENNALKKSTNLIMKLNSWKKASFGFTAAELYFPCSVFYKTTGGKQELIFLSDFKSFVLFDHLLL